MSYLLLSILVAFLTVITLTKSQNINHKTHDVPAPPNGLISYPPPTSDLQKLVGLKYVRGPNQHRRIYQAPPPPFAYRPRTPPPRTPHVFSPHRRWSRPPPIM
ncbi:hypothetical protein P8452_69873 [Trifolium repens]|nr:hypothetical protein P8452_69873 [Trifolium repens]